MNVYDISIEKPGSEMLTNRGRCVREKKSLKKKLKILVSLKEFFLLKYFLEIEPQFLIS